MIQRKNVSVPPTDLTPEQLAKALLRPAKRATAKKAQRHHKPAAARRRMAAG